MGVMLKLVRRMTVNHVICMDGQFESVCSHKILLMRSWYLVDA